MDVEQLDQLREDYVRRRTRRMWRDVLLGTLALMIWALVSFKLIELI